MLIFSAACLAAVLWAWTDSTGTKTSATLYTFRGTTTVIQHGGSLDIISSDHAFPLEDGKPFHLFTARTSIPFPPELKLPSYTETKGESVRANHLSIPHWLLLLTAAANLCFFILCTEAITRRAHPMNQTARTS